MLLLDALWSEVPLTNHKGCVWSLVEMVLFGRTQIHLALIHLTHANWYEWGCIQMDLLDWTAANQALRLVCVYVIRPDSRDSVVKPSIFQHCGIKESSFSVCQIKNYIAATILLKRILSRKPRQTISPSFPYMHIDINVLLLYFLILHLILCRNFW